MKKILTVTLCLLSAILYSACDYAADFFMRNKSSYTIYVIAPDFRIDTVPKKCVKSKQSCSFAIIRK